ncbi:MAG: hypothetical protein ABEH38_00640 [Flavobacteriales bacterium]
MASLVNIEVAFISFLILVIIYLTRFLMLKTFWKKGSKSALFIAPRGSVTILLFYAIPDEFRSEAFSKGLLLYPILLTSIIMAISLVKRGSRMEAVPGLTASGAHSGTSTPHENPGLSDPEKDEQKES